MSADYGQTGIGGNVEIGKGGPRYKDASGVVQFRNGGDTVFAKVQGADPTVDDDLATKRYVDSAGGTPNWATVLATGPSAGANNPIIPDGQSIIGDDVAGNAGSYTVRAGNQTQATGSVIAGDLTVKGGDNASSGNAARGGHLVIAGGTTTLRRVPSVVTLRAALVEAASAGRRSLLAAKPPAAARREPPHSRVVTTPLPAERATRCSAVVTALPGREAMLVERFCSGADSLAEMERRLSLPFKVVSPADRPESPAQSRSTPTSRCRETIAKRATST